MLIDWTHAGAPALASFLASLVEVVEAFTIVLAVGVVRSWRGALTGVAVALITLATMAAFMGSALAHVPLDWAKVGVGYPLVLFGLRWLRKAMLRAAGVIPMHDEQVAYANQTKALLGAGSVMSRWDAMAIGMAFKITMIEGLEVVFIVIAVGAGDPGSLLWASGGAFAAFVLASLTAAVLRRPLTKIPENTLKFTVGIILTSAGTYWVGEGCGVDWPGGDVSLLLLASGFLAVALFGVRNLARNGALTNPSKAHGRNGGQS